MQHPPLFAESGSRFVPQASPLKPQAFPVHNWLRLLKDMAVNRRGGVPKRPGWCTYLVTYRCNARCGMCDSWRIKPGTELTVLQVEHVFRKVGRLDVVRLTGGEPFLRDDFPEVVTAVDRSSHPAVLHITSNGSYPDRMVDFVKNFERPKKLRFMISLDGMHEEHDASRGKDVLFSIAEEAIHRLAELRKQYGIAVSVNHTVISSRSLDDHEQIVQRFAPLGIDVQSVLAYSDSAMYGLKRQRKKAEDLIPEVGYPLHPKLAEADCVGFVEKSIKRLDQLNDRMLRHGKRYYLVGLLARLRGERGAQPRPKCVALRSHLRILPDGSVPVCQFNSERVGNLLTEEFDQLWHSEPTVEGRRWVDGCPGCWAECEVMPSALYTGDLLWKGVVGVPTAKAAS